MRYTLVMAEHIAPVNGIDLCYETYGDPVNPTVLLVMGLGTQMIAWHEDFCELIAAEGFHVVRYDNRDVGRSTHFRDVRPPRPVELFTRRIKNPAYTLEDMADDAVGLLEHLGVDGAHVVGASMGGMIAQTVAVRSPARVLSLTSIMSTTGGRFVGQPKPHVYSVLLKPAPPERDAFVERGLHVLGIIGSKAYPGEPDEVRERMGRAFDRAYDPGGAGRQLGAIVAAGNRTRALRTITAPTLVLHGEADPLIPMSGGRATAAAIPGAVLELIPKMGHDLPYELWPRIAGGIVRNARRAPVRASAPAA